MITIMRGRHTKDVNWSRDILSIRKLAKELSVPKIVKDKDDPPHMVFVIGNKKRLAKNVESYTAVIIDFDDCKASLEDILKPLKPLKFIFHSTFSHTIKGNRYRAIIPFSKPLPQAEFEQIYQSLAALFPTNSGIDPSAKAEMRFFYNPSCLRKNRKDFVFKKSLIGDWVNEVDLPEPSRASTSTGARDWEDAQYNDDSNFDPTALPQQGNRNIWMTQFIGYLYSLGLSTPDVKEQAMEKNAEFDEPLRNQEVKNTVRQINRREKQKQLTMAEYVYLLINDHYHNTIENTSYPVKAIKNIYNMTDTNLKKLIHSKTISVAYNTYYAPGERQIFFEEGKYYANTWRPCEIEPTAGDVQPMLNHVNNIYGSDAEVFLNWVAFLIQNPGKKMRWTIITKGIQGIGKSLFAEKVIIPLIGGTKNSHTIANKEEMESQFNSWSESQFVIFEEIEGVKSSQLNVFISNDNLPVRKMRHDSIMIRNRSNCLMFTNSEYALTGIGAQARRFYFVRSEAEELTDNEVINIKAFFASHQSEMLHYFLNRDLEDFNPNKRPTNSYTQQQISEGFRWPFDIFNEELENPDAQICTLPVVTRRYLQTLVISKSVGRNHERAVGLTPNQLSKHLETVGFRHMPHPTKDKQAMRIPIKGKQETIYVTPFGLKLGVNSWTTEDVRYCCEELNYPSEWDEDE